MEGEVKFDIDIKLPRDIAEDFYKIFNEFLSEDIYQIKSYFSELLSYKRCVINLEIVAPIIKIAEMDKYLKNNGYLIYYHMGFVKRNDENKDYIPQDLFDKYPNELMGVITLYISYREDFLHLVQMIDNIPFGCDVHKYCDSRAALRGLLFGYKIKNIIGFIEQKNKI